jgi:hypothetical protein
MGRRPSGSFQHTHHATGAGGQRLGEKLFAPIGKGIEKEVRR